MAKSDKLLTKLLMSLDTRAPAINFHYLKKALFALQ